MGTAIVILLVLLFYGRRSRKADIVNRLRDKGL